VKGCGPCIPRGYIPVAEDGVLNDVTLITGMKGGAGTSVESSAEGLGPGKTV